MTETSTSCEKQNPHNTPILRHNVGGEVRVYKGGPQTLPGYSFNSPGSRRPKRDETIGFLIYVNLILMAIALCLSATGLGATGIKLNLIELLSLYLLK